MNFTPQLSGLEESCLGYLQDRVSKLGKGVINRNYDTTTGKLSEVSIALTDGASLGLEHGIRASTIKMTTVHLVVSETQPLDQDRCRNLVNAFANVLNMIKA